MKHHGKGYIVVKIVDSVKWEELETCGVFKKFNWRSLKYTLKLSKGKGKK